MQVDDQLLVQMRSLPIPTVIAISGFGGSGKSSLAARLGEHLVAPVISVDSFIKDRYLADYNLWECVDYDRMEREVLIPLSTGAMSIEFGHLDWHTNTVGSKRVLYHCQRAIVEGVGLLRPSLLKYFTYSVWVDCPIKEAIQRGKKRDREADGNPQDESWDGIWRSNDEEFYRRYQPDKAADYLFDNTAPKD